MSRHEGSMKAEELRANYTVIDDPEKNVGWVRPKAVTRQTESAGYATLTIMARCATPEDERHYGVEGDGGRS